jgi:hypothetical protein
MDEDIRNHFEMCLDNEDDMKLKNMIEVVLAMRNRETKTRVELRNELDAIRRGQKETIASYRARFNKAAERDGITDDRELREIYVNGMEPKPVVDYILDRLEPHSTLEDVHQLALRKESSYVESNKITERKLNQKPSVQQQPPSSKSAGGSKVTPPNTNDTPPSNPPSKPPPQQQHGTPKVDANGQWKNPSTGKVVRTCGYCKVLHTSALEQDACVKKYKQHYTPEELALLREIKVMPTVRANAPKDGERLTRETPWVKKKLEEIEKGNDKPVKQGASATK